MRKPHWNGNAPKNDEHAKELIINAALKVADQKGLDKTNIKEVAAELSITRQTVYRLFPSTDDLLLAVSIAAGGKLVNKLLKHTAKFKTFDDRVVECIIFMARNIPKDDFLKRYFLAADEIQPDIRVAFSRHALNYAVQILKAFHPEEQHILNDEELLELAEHMQRLLLAMIIAPSERISTSKGMRVYLDHWLRPLLIR